MKKRIFAVLLCICLLAGLVPTMAFAEEPTVSVWDGSSVATAYESGNGTEDSPYEIASAEQFAYFAQRISSGYETEAYYVLSCDLDLSAANWTPIGGYPDNIFKGTFDGRGHTIRYVISSYSPTGPYYSFIGLFEYVEGDISNLDVEGSITLFALEREVSLGGLSGIFDGNITNCESNVDITYASNQGAVWIGGFIGQYRAGTIQECAYTGEISAMDNTGQAVAGGICGAFHGGTIDSCKNAGTIICVTNDSSAIDVAGGIVGFAIASESDVMLTVRNCYNEGAVSGNYVGGIIGYVDAYNGDIFVENCYSSTMASGTAAQGALVGQNDEGAGSLTVQNCYYLTGTDYYGSKAADLNEIYEKLSESSQEGVWGKDATGAPRLCWEYSAAPEPTTYTLLVDLEGGSGSAAGGEYAEGAVINIDAGTRSNYRFSGWTSSNGGSFANASSPRTTFTMPADDTTITATWQYNVGTGKAVQIDASQIKGGQSSSVYFGNYYQSDASGNTKEPIKWRVLSDADGTLFLLSDQNLDVQPYNSSHTSITWENCTLRTWLNGMFLTAAFSNDEQGAIANTYVYNATQSDGTSNPNPDYDISGGNDTTDKIFLLSIEEANNSGYFPNRGSRISTNTAYTASRNTSMSGAGAEDYWWLRSPGGFDRNSAMVDNWGEVYYIGYGVDGTFYAVRPAFNLDLNSVLFTSAADNSGHISFGTAIPDYSGSEWKVTLKDSNDFSSGASVSGTTSLMAGYSDTMLTIHHTALSSLSGDYTDVTAALTDASGSLLYYGSVNSNTSATESTVTIPAGLTEGTYTLSIYGEDWNGANGTDYATGTPYTVTLTVDNIPPSYSISTSSSRLYFQSATEGYLGGEAWYVTVTNTGNQNVTVALPASTNYTITAQRGFTGGTADLAPDGTARFSVGPKTGLAAGSYNETLTISGSNGASASIELYFTVTHNYGTDWETDADKHWHECSCGAKTDEAEHEYDDEQDTTCNVCGYVRGTVPTGEIKIAEIGWKTFLNDITFELFFKDTQTVTITADDNSGETVTIEYLLSDKVFTEDELANMTFTEYSAPFGINPNNEYVIYAKLTDTSGMVAYINTDGMVLDATIPVISGIENGKTYCAEQTVTIIEKYISTVTVNGKVVTLDSNHQFVLNPAEGTQTIVVTDKAGNETTVSVTVNSGHKPTKTEAKASTCTEEGNTEYWTCETCGKYFSDVDGKTEITLADTVIKATDHKLTKTEAKAATCTEDGNTEYWTCDTCGRSFEDADCKAEIADLDIWKVIPKLDHIWSADYRKEHADGEKHYHVCTICGTRDAGEVHIWNVETATKETDKHCTVCGYVAEAQLGHVHAGKYVAGKDATCIEDGSREYWTCDICGKFFEDESCKAEITDLDTWKVIPKLDHTWSTDYLKEHADADKHYHVCTVCDTKDAGEAHTWNVEAATEETDKHCTVCGYVAEEKLEPVHTHQGKYIAGKDATCTENGNKEYYSCSCGRFFEDESCTIEITDLDTWKVIPKLDHTWSADYLKEHADAEKHYHVCTVCGTKDAGETHTWNVEAATEETDKHCIVCGYVAEAQLGHVHKLTHTPAKAATCTDEGNKEYWYCDTCGKYFRDEELTQEITKKETVIEARGHGKAELKNKKDATCTTEGYTGDKICKDCGEVLEKGETIPKLAHSYKAGTCTVCGAFEPNYKPADPAGAGSNERNNDAGKGSNSPKTGDNSNIALWIFLMLVAGAALAGTDVYIHKKKRSK